MITNDTHPRIVARGVPGCMPIYDTITSAIVSLLWELRRNKRAHWSPSGIDWLDIYLRPCHLYYDGRECQYEVGDGPGRHTGLPLGPAADVFREYCASLLDALANQRPVTIGHSLGAGYSGILWQEGQGRSLAIAIDPGNCLTATVNAPSLPTDIPYLITYSVWD